MQICKARGKRPKFDCDWTSIGERVPNDLRAQVDPLNVGYTLTRVEPFEVKASVVFRVLMV